MVRDVKFKYIEQYIGYRLAETQITKGVLILSTDIIIFLIFSTSVHLLFSKYQVLKRGHVNLPHILLLLGRRVGCVMLPY